MANYFTSNSIFDPLEVRKSDVLRFIRGQNVDYYIYYLKWRLLADASFQDICDEILWIRRNKYGCDLDFEVQDLIFETLDDFGRYIPMGSEISPENIMAFVTDYPETVKQVIGGEARTWSGLAEPVQVRSCVAFLSTRPLPNLKKRISNLKGSLYRPWYLLCYRGRKN